MGDLESGPSSTPPCLPTHGGQTRVLAPAGPHGSSGQPEPPVLSHGPFDELSPLGCLSRLFISRF